VKLYEEHKIQCKDNQILQYIPWRLEVATTNPKKNQFKAYSPQKKSQCLETFCNATIILETFMVEKETVSSRSTDIVTNDAKIMRKSKASYHLEILAKNIDPNLLISVYQTNQVCT
jgi:competence CoiA-like predicted nuclease